MQLAKILLTSSSECSNSKNPGQARGSHGVLFCSVSFGLEGPMLGRGLQEAAAMAHGPMAAKAVGLK